MKYKNQVTISTFIITTIVFLAVYFNIYRTTEYTNFNEFLLLSVHSYLVLVLIMTILWRYIATETGYQIEKITQKMKEILDGNLKVTVEDSPIKEFQILADSLNRIIVSFKLAVSKKFIKKKRIIELKRTELKKPSLIKRRYKLNSIVLLLAFVSTIMAILLLGVYSYMVRQNVEGFVLSTFITNVIIYTIFVSIIVVILSQISFKYSSGKVVALSKKVDMISKGELDTDLGTNSIYEVQELIDVLNSLIDEMKKVIAKYNEKT